MDVICPYFHRVKRTSIYCEGVQEGCVCTVLTFGSRAEMGEHITEACNSFDYSKRCRIARALNDKYN